MSESVTQWPLLGYVYRGQQETLQAIADEIKHWQPHWQAEVEGPGLVKYNILTKN
jgi:hypothetical protein